MNARDMNVFRRACLQRRGLDVLPQSSVLLRPRETTDLTFFYRPAARAKPWSEPLVLDVDGVELNLLTLTGACQVWVVARSVAQDGVL